MNPYILHVELKIHMNGLPKIAHVLTFPIYSWVVFLFHTTTQNKYRISTHMALVP